MNRKIFSGIIIALLLLSSIGLFAYTIHGSEDNNQKDVIDIQKTKDSDNYEIQWQKNYGSDWSGGRFQGPQPIGDCDNDGENELLIAGRDGKIDVMKWNENKLTYESTAILHSPFYTLFLLREFIVEQFLCEYSPPFDAGGFAIGDITGDGKNEIAAT